MIKVVLIFLMQLQKIIKYNNISKLSSEIHNKTNKRVLMQNNITSNWRQTK